MHDSYMSTGVLQDPSLIGLLLRVFVTSTVQRFPWQLWLQDVLARSSANTGGAIPGERPGVWLGSFAKCQVQRTAGGVATELH